MKRESQITVIIGGSFNPHLVLPQPEGIAGIINDNKRKGEVK